MKTTVPLACKLLIIAFFSIIRLSAFSQQTLTSINGWNAYVHLPDDYNTSGTHQYPTIIFFPGSGEVGTDPSKLLINGPGHFIAGGWNGYVTVNGTTIKPIIISLQPPSLWPQPALLDQEIESIKTMYRVDPARLSLTGLSMGGWASELYVEANAAYASKIASLVALQAVKPDDNAAYPTPFAGYARNCGHWLGYEQINDFRDMNTIANTMNAAIAGSAVFIQTNVGGGGHCCWNTWYDPTHTDSYALNGVSGNWSVYQYMLTYSNCSSGTGSIPPVNTPPIVAAGIAQTITLPSNSVTLAGTSSGVNGATISSTTWTETSGGSATINSPATLSTSVSGLTAGSYVFMLTAKDNHGLFSTSNVGVTVNAATTGNAPPIVNAGTNQTIIAPASSVLLKGTVAGVNGATISSTGWSQASGAKATIGSNSLTTTMSGLTPGTYVFTLMAQDNHGLRSTGNVTITVNPAIVVNTPPIVNAGGNLSITLPANSVTLSGTSSGVNGATIASVAWTKTSGGTATINSPSSLSSTVSGLAAGSYLFMLTSTDNHGLSATSNMTVTVNPAVVVNAPPIVNAGSNQTITAPASSVLLKGTVAGVNGATISSTGWSQASGAKAIIESNSLTTTMSGLTPGIYVFTLMAQDNQGLRSTANVTITVNPAIVVNAPPVVNAGGNQSITLPTSSVMLAGTSSGVNGTTISSVAWAKTSGGPATINSPSSLSGIVTGLTAGTYTFMLTVTDNNGLFATSNVIVTVNNASSTVSSCGCDFTLTPPAADGQIYLDGTTLGVKPGNIVCLKATHFTSIFLYNFYGSATQPITVINCGGQVNISGYNSYGFIISHSSYVHVSGAGDAGYKYGILIDGAPGNTSYGYSENGHVRDIEVDHLEVKNIAGVGMGCAPTPSCDSTTWSTSWKMYNISFHDNFVHDTQGEGYYIGNTQYDYTYTCGGVDLNMHPQQIDSVKFYNNIIDKAGWTAAQISQVTGGVDIHDNLITNYGYLNKPQHQAGIIVGEFSHGSVYRNKILNGTGDAFQYFGSGTTLVYNNIFANAGYDGSAQGQPAVFVDDRALPAGYPHLQLYFINNTIVAPARNAISFYNDYGTVENNNIIANNIITAPGILSSIPAVAYFDLQANPHVVPTNNLLIPASSSAKFLNLAANDFHLLPGSPAIDAGMNVSNYGVTTDMEGKARPYGSAYDIGAYEYSGTTSTAFTAQSLSELSKAMTDSAIVGEKFIAYPNPVRDIMNINWESNYQGKAVITICDVTGRNLQTISTHKVGMNFTSQLTLSTWKTGTYFLKIQLLDGRIITQKIMKQ